MTSRKLTYLEAHISSAIREERQRASRHQGSNQADDLARSVAAKLVERSMLDAPEYARHVLEKGNF